MRQASPGCTGVKNPHCAGGDPMVPHITTVLQRFTTEWAALLQPDAILAVCGEISYIGWRGQRRVVRGQRGTEPHGGRGIRLGRWGPVGRLLGAAVQTHRTVTLVGPSGEHRRQDVSVQVSASPTARVR